MLLCFQPFTLLGYGWIICRFPLEPLLYPLPSNSGLLFSRGTVISEAIGCCRIPVIVFSRPTVIFVLPLGCLLKSYTYIYLVKEVSGYSCTPAVILSRVTVIFERGFPQEATLYLFIGGSHRIFPHTSGHPLKSDSYICLGTVLLLKSHGYICTVVEVSGRFSTPKAVQQLYSVV